MVSSDFETYSDPAAEALRRAGVAVEPVGDEFERWAVGDFVFSDAELIRLAESRGLILP